MAGKLRGYRHLVLYAVEATMPDSLITVLYRSSNRVGVARIQRSLFGTLLVALVFGSAVAQQPSPTCPNGIRLAGAVRDADGQPVKDAIVHLSAHPSVAQLETKTDAYGRFSFSSVSGASFHLQAERADLIGATKDILPDSGGCELQVDLVLGTKKEVPSKSKSSSITQAMEFADDPSFTIAGVTDWTAVGGHGSDSILRTTETLANETRGLGAQGSAGVAKDSAAGAGGGQVTESELLATLARDPSSFRPNHQLGVLYLNSKQYAKAIPPLERALRAEPANQEVQYDLVRADQGAGDVSQARQLVHTFVAKQKSADLCRVAAELDEQSGDPLSAVREYEEAAKLDPSEQNYFEWGSDLLLHRAVWQALAVLRTGANAYPKSIRMQTAFGTALFAGARYDQAAQRFCLGSDLSPQDPHPYVFMGKIQVAAPEPLACIEPRLARFVQLEPNNAEANFLYAMSILKRQGQKVNEAEVGQAKALLVKAISLDPKYGEAYLQLGILNASEGSFEQAIHLYKEAIAADPHLADAHYRLGVAYDRTGQQAMAKQEFQLHDQIKQEESDQIEKERKEVKQFLIVLPDASGGNSVQ